MSPLLKLLYPLVYALALPWILYRLGLGSLRARCGFVIGAAPPGSIWLHGSSVGEVTLLGPLVERLEQAGSAQSIVVSAYTQTGLATVRSRYPRHRAIAFPLDFAFAVRRCLRRLDPRIIVVAESELWPQFLTVAAQRGIPVVIVNAKMSEKSLRLHLRTRFVAQSLRGVAAIGAQNEEHATRLRALGVDAERISVTGNMKYDLVAPPRDHDDDGRARLGLAPTELVIIGGSLHEHEDELLLDAVRSLREHGIGPSLIIVPRYPRDAARVVEHAIARGFSCIRKSALDRDCGKLANGEILVVDTLGELRGLYGISDIAFVGGSSFYRGSNKGGHNLMEPAICGVPVLFGPYNFSFRETADELIAADAGIRVDGAAALGAALLELAREPLRCREMGQRARALVLAHQGATARNFSLIESALAGGQH